jgi:hypothetical protein
MVIKETDAIVSNLHEKIIGKEKTIALADLKKRDIPSFIKNYFDREAENWIREESSMFLSSGRFNYDLPEVRKKFDELYEVLKNTAIFNQARLHRILEQGVKLQTNFLIQPERTMVQFIFRDYDVITPAEVMDSMKYFIDFDYYYKSLQAYFKSNPMETISKTTFKSFIQQLDEKAFKENTTQAAVNVASVIVGFLNLGREKQSDALDPEVLASAYQDRNLPKYQEAAKNMMSKNWETVNVSKLDGFFTAFLEGGDVEAKPVKEEKVKTDYQEKTDIIFTKDFGSLVSDIKVEKGEEEEVSSVDSFLTEDEEDIVLPSAPAPQEYKAPETPVATGSAADQLAAVMAEKLGQATVLKDLYQVIEDKDKKTYIKKLFKKKDKEFFQLLNDLNAINNWPQANTLIEDVFYNHDINPYQKEAIAFTDAVYTRYFPPKD